MSRFRNPYAPRQYATAEQAAGMTGLHRDTRGNIIGGYAADGTPIGSRSKQPATSATPRLDAGVQTPRLNSNPTVATQRPSRFRSYQGLGDGATKGAASGSPLLRQRQKLFDDMQKAGPDLGGDLAERAKSLGVADSTFRTVAQRIGKRAPAMEPVKSRFMAAAGYPAKPSAQAPASVQPPVMAKATVKPQGAPTANFTPAATVSKPKGGIVSVGAQTPNPLVRAWKSPIQTPTGSPFPSARQAAKPNALVRSWKQPAAQMPGPPSPSLASAAGYGKQAAKVAKPTKLPDHRMTTQSASQERMKIDTNAMLDAGQKRIAAERAAVEADDSNVPSWLRGTIAGRALKTLQKPIL